MPVQGFDPQDLPPLPTPAPAWRNLPRTPEGVSDISDLINENVGLVYFVLGEQRRRSNFLSRFYRSGSQNEEDLVQAGLEGLAEAIRCHNPQKGKLSTIAVPIIRRRIWAEARRRRQGSAGYEQARDGKAPGLALRACQETRGEAEAWKETRQGRGPNSYRGENALRSKKGWLADAVEHFHYVGSDDEFDGSWEAGMPVDPGSTLRARREEEEVEERREEDTRLLAKVRALLPRLPLVERVALERHYGLAGGDQKNPLEIGKALAVSEATARQIICRGIKNLQALMEEQNAEQP
jgi:RNA polymerase sigma factor (sigma-70 family)